MSIATLQMVTIDCPDPVALGRFYQGVLGGELDTGEEGWAVLRPVGGTPLGFQGVSGHTAPTWPEGAVPQQSHLDLTVRDLDAAEREVLALGATLLAARPEHGWRVYADPVGHTFCLGL
ncbi:VOC family protein [Streptomyces sp. NPDC020875]|uniref:VOC family protein n=1 Tax=Streptomyces sp. NPDC020875 TaxID=3154898 RepID=UPI0033C60026